MKIDYTQLTVRQLDSRQRPSTTAGDRSAEASRIHTVVNLTRHRKMRSTTVPKRTAPSKTNLNKQIDEKFRTNGVEAGTRTQGGSSVARIARHVARWNTRAESAKPQGRGTQAAFRQQVQYESDRCAVTLDEKDDQKIFQNDSSLQRMRRLFLW